MIATTRDPAALLDHPLVGERYLFPRRARVAAPLFVESGDARLACALHRCPGAAPDALTIVHFHGNGEVVADWEEGFPERIAELGCHLLLAEYRGYGMSTGTPLLGRMLDDVPAVVRAAGPEERVVLFGRSVGSIFALEAAARFPRAAGLVLESGIADVLERLLLRLDPAELGATGEELAAAVAARLDHRRKISSYRGPTLVMHALFDDLVPASHGERLAEWAGGPATLQLFDRGDHNSILAENEERYLVALADLVRAAGGAE